MEKSYPNWKLPEDDKDRLAARILDDLLGGRFLNPPADEPPGLSAAAAAPRTAHEIIVELSRLYGIRRWDRDAFRTILLGRVYPAWKRDFAATVESGGLRIESSGCPIRNETARDPRVCLLCQAAQEHLAQDAMPTQRLAMRFLETVAGGGSRCVAILRERK